MKFNGRRTPARRRGKPGKAALVLVAAVIVAILLLVTPCAFATPGWSWLVNVSGNGPTPPSNNQNPQIALDAGGNSHVVWMGKDGSSTRIYYSENTGGGWSDPKNISTTSTGNNIPQIALDEVGGVLHVHVTWASASSYIYYAEKTGSVWSGPVKVSGTLTGNNYPHMALDTGGDPHVVWNGYDGSTNRIYYAEKTGSVWSDPVNISPTIAISYDEPQIAVDEVGGVLHVHVTWSGKGSSNYRIYYAKKTGGAWSTPVVISGAIIANKYPQIALDGGGNPHITWCTYHSDDGSQDKIYYSENTGSGWTGPDNISTTSTRNSSPQIALDEVGGFLHVHVTWSGYDGSMIGHIYYAEKTGSVWSGPVDLCGAWFVDSYNPQIAIDTGGNPHVTWTSEETVSYNYGIYYAEKTGSAWAGPMSISGGPISNNKPQIALDALNHSHIVWFGVDNGTYFDIFYTDMAYYISASANPATGGTVSGAGTYVPGTTVKMHATANTGYHFVNWTDHFETWEELGDTVSTDPDYSFTATANHTLVANFELNNYTISASANTPAGGTLSGAGSYTYGATVKMHANPSAGYHFVNWTEGGTPVSSDPDYSFTAKADRTLVANFADTYTIFAEANVLASGTGGTVTGAGTYTPGASVSMHAVANTGYHFVNWTEGGTPVSTDQDYSFNVTTDRTLMANFALNTYNVTASVSGGHGTATPPTQNINYGANVTVDIKPDADYHAISVTDNGTPVMPVPTTSYAINNVTSDHNVVVTFAQDEPTWYLAEGTTAWGFSTHITIENPNDAELHARLTYMDPRPETGETGKGRVAVRTVTLPPLSQTTVDPAGDLGPVDFSTRVDCIEGKSIAVDRTIYWTGKGAPSAEAHNSIGVTAPAKVWYLSEGSSEWGFETWTLVQNPNSTEANVTLTYMTEDAGFKTLQKKIPAYSRATYSMEKDIGAHDSSIKVTSDVPVIAERSQYRNNRREGSCSIGTTAPATDYFLSEGTTAWGFTTYVLVQNPNDSSVQVTLTYMTPKGPAAQPAFTMPANSRKTIRVNDIKPSNGYPIDVSNTDLSTQVHGSAPIIAERSMYWKGGPDSGEACHDSIGLASSHTSFYLPDGQTSNNWETWTLVQNPNPGAVTVQVSYLPAGGGNPVTFKDEIPANSRKIYNMAGAASYPGIQGRASIMVRSLDDARPIMVERSMYCYGRGLGTDTGGAYSD